MGGVRGYCIVLGVVCVLSAHQAVCQTVNLFGSNWTGDVSPDCFNRSFQLCNAVSPGIGESKYDAGLSLLPKVVMSKASTEACFVGNILWRCSRSRNLQFSVLGIGFTALGIRNSIQGGNGPAILLWVTDMRHVLSHARHRTWLWMYATTCPSFPKQSMRSCWCTSQETPTNAPAHKDVNLASACISGHCTL